MHLAVAKVWHLLPFEAEPQSNDKVGDLVVFVQRRIVLPLDVQNFAAKRQDCLERPVASLLCTAAYMPYPLLRGLTDQKTTSIKALVMEYSWHT